MRAWLSLLLLSPALCIADAVVSMPAHGVTGVQAEHLDATYWIRAQHEAQRVIVDADAIAALNATLERLDPTVHDVEALPASMTRASVLEWLQPLSQRPTRTLYDEHGDEISADALDAIVASAAVDRVPEQVAARYGMVVRRAALRTFPTSLRVFSGTDNTDIDRFQESALFPGTPVRVLHESRDGAWWFVVSPRYAAWIERTQIAVGARDAVFGYARKQPHLVVTGAKVETVYNPQNAALSELQLDMGVRVPLLADWPADRAVDGQHPYAAHVIELPLRDAGGALRFAPALLPLSADVSTDFLPFTQANLLRQSFKFLGERYGWGHSYNARDCSGFVSEVYRSLGIELPRNTRDQGTSEAFERIALDASMTREQRLAILQTLQVGDLVYIPGHVMMVIGRVDGITYVIHDTTGIGVRDGDGAYRRVPLNQVAVTPLEPLQADEQRATFENIYGIQRIRPRTNQDSTLQ